MVGKMSLVLLNLESLKFLMHFREPRISFHFISYILIFFSFFFFIYTRLFFLLLSLFLFAPLEL
jgi:hypothetical protein